MSKLNRIRILVVDDDKDVASLLAMLLGKNDNWEIIIANTGQEGVEQALAHPPTVIITDLMMPGIDGFVLMETIQKALPDLPIIVITAYGSMDAAIKALKLGAFDFLSKPFDPVNLKATVNRAIQRQLTEETNQHHQHIVNSLSTSRDPIYIAQQLLSLSANALGAEHGLIWWADQVAPALFLAPPDKYLQIPLLKWARTAGLTKPNVEQLSAQLAPVIQIDQNPPFSGSLLGLPLFTHNTPHCVLILAHSAANYFNPQDLAFLTNLASFASMALANAKTYAHLEASNQRLSTLQGINALTYNAELPLNRILRLAVEGIRQNMKYPVVLLCLSDNNGKLLIRAAAGHLDKFLDRRGDTPSRQICFPTKDRQNPFSLTYQSQKIQNAPAEVWALALRKADAEDLAQSITDYNVSHCVGFPLWAGDKVIGVMVVGHAHIASLPPEEQALLTTLANQLTLVVTNASLYQAEQQGRREMEALYRAGLAITSSLSPPEVLRTIVTQIVDLARVEGCIIGRWDRLRNTEVVEIFLQKTATGWLEKVPPGTAYLLAERPFVQQSLEQQSLKVIHRHNPNLSASEKNWMAQADIHQQVLLPLVIRDKSIGVIELLTTQTNRTFTEPTIRLTQGLAAQAAIALENARLHEAEMNRLEEEMDLAHRIQVSLLPDEAPTVPGLSIAARSTSARLVGGDFYRYLSMPDDRFGLVIGDVSGKGVPSALFMAVTITALDNQIKQHISSENILYRLNNALYPRMRANQMNTGLLVAIFNHKTGELEIANAGMIAPLLKTGEQVQWIDVSGLPVGAIPHTAYHSTTVTLASRMVVVLASDGILEAQNHAGELYGFERFQNSVQKLPSLNNSQAILEQIWQDAANFVQGAEPHDDMTLIVVQVE